MYLNNAQSLVDGGFRIKGETGIDFGRNFTGDDFEDLLAKFDQKTVYSEIHLLIDVFALVLAVRDGRINKTSIFRFFGCGEE